MSLKDIWTTANSVRDLLAFSYKHNAKQMIVMGDRRYGNSVSDNTMATARQHSWYKLVWHIEVVMKEITKMFISIDACGLAFILNLVVRMRIIHYWPNDYAHEVSRS